MIYAALALWVMLALAAGRGVCVLWARLAGPAVVNWALLPGTVVSEMAYIFGCLVTGGEVRHARLMPVARRAGPAGGPGASAHAVRPQGFPRSLVASLVSVAACAAALAAAAALFGGPVLKAFEDSGGLWKAESLPDRLPGSWNGFWEQAVAQVWLLRRVCETWGGLNWLDWRVPLFVYLGACLALRLAPAGRPLGPALAAALVLVAGTAGVGLASDRFAWLMRHRLWHALAYFWSMLLLLLAASLVLHGLAAMVRSLAGAKSTKSRSATAGE